MNYRIAICDDSETDRKYISGLVNQWATSKEDSVQLSTFTSAENFLFHYEDNSNYDILLLDIEMGNMDGVTLAKNLRQNNDTVQIIFITGFADYISQGYDVQALHYLMKPVEPNKIFTVLDRAVSTLHKSEKMLVLPADGKIIRLPLKEIQYIEVFSHTLAVVAKSETFRVKMSLSEIEKMLDDSFVRCHRSYLVGLSFVSRLSKTEVILDTGKILPLSRNAAPLVHKAFINYYTGEKDETI